MYEKVQFGDDPDQRAYDCEDETTGRKRTKTPVAAVPMRYNYRQHVIPGRVFSDHSDITSKQNIKNSGFARRLVYCSRCPKDFRNCVLFI